MYRFERDEIVREPLFMLNDLYTQGYMEGDCDDFTTLISSLLTALNIPNRMVAVRTNPDMTEYDHVFVETPINGAVVRLDATVHPWVSIPEQERMEINVIS